MKSSSFRIIITFRNLYWSFYGYLAPWDYKVVVGNAGTNSEPTEHIFTIIAGEVIVAIFHLTVVVALLNLMVTMLVKKADEVQVDTPSAALYYQVKRIVSPSFVDAVICYNFLFLNRA